MAGNQSFYIDLTLKSKLLLLESSVSDFTPLKLQAQTSTSIVRLMMQNSDASRFMSLVWDSAGGAEVLNIVGDSQTPAQFFRTGNVTLTSSTTNSVNIKGNTLLLNSNSVAAQTTSINMGGSDGVMIISAENGFGGTAAQLRLFGPAHVGAPSDVRFRQNGVDSFQITGSTRRMTIGVSGDTNQHLFFGSFDSVNPSTGAVEWKFAKDTNAGDSTNIAQLAIGNNGTNQGRVRLGFTNAAATGSPSANISFDPRNNANTTNYNAGRLNFSKVAGNDGSQLILQTSTTGGVLTTALAINENQLLTLGAGSTDLAHLVNGGFELTTNNNGIGIGGAASSINIMNLRRDQNTLTRIIFRNTHVGSSANVRVSLAAEPGDVDWTAGSIAAGASTGIQAGAGYTGGFNISIAGNNPLSFSTNSTQQLLIQGNGAIIASTSFATGVNATVTLGAIASVVQSSASTITAAKTTANSIASIGTTVQDGTNNKRIALFADHLNQSVGIVYGASSGAPPLFFANAFTGKVPLSFSAADLVTIGGTGLTQTHLVRSRGLATTDAPSGVGTGFSAVHDSNTAGSAAVFAAQVAGSSADDPYIAFIVNGQNSFSLGIDNSDSDSLKLSLGTSLGSTDYLKVSTIGAFTIGASGNSNQHNINGSVRITNVSGPILELLDGGTFGSNADPYMSFRDSSVEGGRVGFDSAVSSTLRLRNIISGGAIALSTNQLSSAFTIPDSTTGHDTNYAQLTQTIRFGNANIFIGRSATEYGYIGFNARTKSSPNAYEYESGDTASILQFNDGGFNFRGTNTIGTIGGAITFTELMRLNKNGVLMINTTTAAASTPYIDFVRGTVGTATGVGHLRLSDITTDATGKQTAISLRHTTNAEEDVAILYASGSDLYLGGGLSALNAASTIRFMTGATTTTTSGTEAMRIASTQSVYINTTANQGGHTNERFVVFTNTGTAGVGADSWASIVASTELSTLNAMTSGTITAGIHSSYRRNVTSQTGNITDTSAGGLAAYTAEARVSTAPTFSYINATTAGLSAIRVQGMVLAGGGTTSITNYHGIRVDSDAGATGTNKFGLWVGDMSGATNNWQIFTTTVGSVRLGNTLRVGNITGILSLDNEQVSVRRLLQAGDLALGNIAGQFEYNNNNDAGISVGATQGALGGIFRRSITTSVTDSSSANYSSVGGSFVFSVSSGQTYTNASQTIATILAGSPGLSGGGSLALTHYAGVLVASSSINTGTNKYGVRINAQTGATNNYGLYQEGTTSINYIEGGLGNSAIPDATNIFVFRKDQNALTRAIFRNTSTGASATIRFSISSDAGDVNMSADSVAGGSAWGISADSTFTGGGSINQLGNNQLKLTTNGSDRLVISGAGALTLGTSGGAAAHTMNGFFTIQGTGTALFQVKDTVAHSSTGAPRIAFTAAASSLGQIGYLTPNTERFEISLTTSVSNFRLSTNSVAALEVDQNQNTTLPNGHLFISSVGRGISIKEGTNAKMGIATLVAGTVVVSTTAVGANSRVFLTGQNSSGTAGEITVSARTAGTSFTITSTSALDTRDIAWVIIDPL